MTKSKSDFGKIEGVVFDILQEYPDSRDSDFVLYARFIQRTTPEIENVGLIYALTHAKALNMPNYETVTRTRRRLQEMYADLRATKGTRENRAKRRAEFKEYARRK